jgi:PilZ domain
VVSRKCPRVAVQLPVGFKGEKIEGKGTVLNISQEGCLIMTETVADPVTYFQLDIHIIDGAAPVRIGLAAVRWSSGSRFGLEYIKVGAEQIERLNHFLAILGREQLG